MNQLELLSPAGDIEIFKAVVNAGADAVYFGGDLFGARAYAKNFTIDEAKEAIKYAHFHGAKAYLTVNTLLKNLEIEKDLYPYLKAYVENGIDAFIVQDMGVFGFIKDFFPNVELHASTQMSICTKEGAQLLQDMGASRIVTAREIATREIAAIHKQCPELEIEAFIHGALCVCYSGQCLMSSIIGGRSGNRGRCAQPCRLPYHASSLDGSSIKSKGEYLLSPKGFCTINYLPEMIDAGVMSFKIEGRMKQLSYATGVVSVYRRYIDEYLSKGLAGYHVSEKDIARLLDYGNRSGFTDLYMTKHNGPELITFEAPSHSKNITEIKQFEEQKVKLNCKVKALVNEAFEITFTDLKGLSVTETGNIIEESKSKPVSYDDIVKAATALGNTSFVVDAVDVIMDEGIFLPVSVIKNTRRQAIEKLNLEYIKEDAPVINPFKEVLFDKNEQSSPKKLFVMVNDISQLKACLGFSFVNRIGVPVSIFDEAYDLVGKDKNLFVVLPSVLREDYLDKLEVDARAAGVVVCSFDGLGLVSRLGIPKDKVILDHRLYTFSNRAIDTYSRLGFENNCIPVELSLKELSHRDNSSSQFIIYSRLPLMVTANCTIKNTMGCNKDNNQYYLTDRKGEKLPVKCNCDYCYNTIYNSKKYSAFDLYNEVARLGAKEYRIDFTLESEKDVKAVLNSYDSVFVQNKPFFANEEYTKGHLKRGVE